MNEKKWDLLHKLKEKNIYDVNNIVKILLKNRGLSTKKEQDEFLKPELPEKLTLRKLGIKATEVNKAIVRLKKAKENGEKVIVFGDYDADGVCAAAILWECLYALGLDTLPYLPDRFSEGYGLKADSIKKLKEKYENLGVIVTVDNGIVAHEALATAKELGIDVIVTDHHQTSRKKLNAYSIIHTAEIGGAAIAWIFAREILKKLKGTKYSVKQSLELAAIGTISDQLPLLGPNRSFAKYGLEALNQTKRVGLLALFKEAKIKAGSLGMYDVNFVIAPRINAMGRLTHAIESLRLLCTGSNEKASNLSLLLGKTNVERQKIVDEVLQRAKNDAKSVDMKGVIVLSHKSYHEGVIGLAASRIVEQYYRPAIVVSIGKEVSKASGRSISGFNLIKAIRKIDKMILEGGGHPMAVGFSLTTNNIDAFTKKLTKISKPLLTKKVLTRSFKVDMEVGFDQLTQGLYKEIKVFEPNGIGNPAPTFMTRKVEVLNSKVVGFDKRHLKLTLNNSEQVFSAIAFGFGEIYPKLLSSTGVDIVYKFEENVWQGQRNLELKIRDIKLNN